MSFPLVITAFGCTAVLSTVGTPYGCFFCTTVRHERVPVRVLVPSVSDVGRGPVLALSLPCCRRRIRRGAQRSSHTATMSRQSVDNSVVTALHRLFGALAALCCLVVAPCWYSVVSSSCQHMSHRVRGGHSTLLLTVHVPARLSLLCRARAAFGPLPRGRIKRRDLLDATNCPGPTQCHLLPASSSRLGLPPGRRACGGVPSLVPGVSRMTSPQARESSPSRCLRGPTPHHAFSIRSPCGPHDDSVTPPVPLAQHSCTDI